MDVGACSCQPAGTCHAGLSAVELDGGCISGGRGAAAIGALASGLVPPGAWNLTDLRNSLKDPFSFSTRLSSPSILKNQVVPLDGNSAAMMRAGCLVLGSVPGIS